MITARSERARSSVDSLPNPSQPNHGPGTTNQNQQEQMEKLKTYSNREARRLHAEAVEIEINPANKGNKQLAAKAKLLNIKAKAVERGGSFTLKELVNGKSKGRSVPEWRQVERLAPECFKGPRSDQWLWLMMDELGIAISGGTRYTGPMTATAVKEDVEKKK